MICIYCGHEMGLIAVNDTGTETDAQGRSFAYNVHHCEPCLTIARENVWSCKGVVWISANNQMGLERENDDAAGKNGTGSKQGDIQVRQSE